MSYKFNPFTKKPDYYETGDSGSTDEVARDNIMILAWKMAIADGLTKFNLEDGVVDEFEDESGVDTDASTNESYNSSDDYYSPTSSYTNEGTGGTITHSGGYTIHTFTSGGTFNPGKVRDVEYLVVAGGGGGGKVGGGGGGGGLLTGTDSSLPLADYTVVVGTGGAGSTSRSASGSNGQNSSYNSHESVGGGGGGSLYDNAENGGSGGGADGDAGEGAKTGGTGTAGQGHDGGDSPNGYDGAGGGGAGSVGQDAQGADNGGNGGAGVNSSISGSEVGYAGGGGGSGTTTAGTATHGGGAGATGNNNGTDGTANTGGGGGGSRDQGAAGGNGGAGGSGVVILRYISEVSTKGMTLISNEDEAEVEPTEARFLALVEPVDSITVNTDLKAYVSNDDGSNYDQVTLSDEGYFDTTKKIFAGNVTLTDRSDKTMRQKIVTDNNKDLKVHAWGLLWK